MSGLLSGGASGSRRLVVVVVAVVAVVGLLLSGLGLVSSAAVVKVASSTSLAVDVPSSVAGQSVTLTATVTSSVAVAGAVTFKRGTKVVGSKPLSGGVAVLVTTKLPVGSLSLTATYAGSTTVLTSTSPAVAETVSKATTTTGLVVDHPSSVAGQSVTLTATVAAVESGAPVPTGTVVFRNGTKTVASKPLAGGVAVLVSSKLVVGALSLTATYGGSALASGSVSDPPVDGSVSKASSSTTLVVDNLAPSAGQTVAVSSRVTVGPPSGEPVTGSVVFKRGTKIVKTVRLVSGVASFSITASATVPQPAGTIPPGPLVLSASYAGTARLNGSAASSPTQATTTTVSADVDPVPVGSPVTFTATVTPVGVVTGQPGGTVSFFDDSSPLGSSILSGGTASLTTSNLSAGSHAIHVLYSGNATYVTSTSDPLSETVSAGATPTSIATGNNGPVTLGNPLGLGAVVTPSGGGTVTGTVTFSEGATVLGSASIGSYGANGAAIVISTLGVGSHPITATYNGDGTFAGSTSTPVAAVVNPGTVTVAVTSGDNPSVENEVVEFTVTVTATVGANPTPTGTVTIVEPPDELSSPISLVDGSATFTTSSLSIGDHVIGASYSGDANFAARQQTPLVQSVRYPTSTAVTSNLNPSNPGDAVTFTATITTAAGTPTGTVEFFVDTDVVGFAPTSGPVAGLTVSNLSSGTHQINVAYLGDATHGGSLSANYIQTVNDVPIAVSVGGTHSCALMGDRTVKCWGGGPLGDGSEGNSSTPVTVTGITTATAVSAGALHTCALLADGTVKCWGSDTDGQLGNGLDNDGGLSTTPVTVTGISNAVAIGAGSYYSCAVLATGSVQCWGSDDHGQLGYADGNGNSNLDNAQSSVPVPVPGVSGALRISTGDSSVCAVQTGAVATCWGDNGSGELGNNDPGFPVPPVAVTVVSNVASIDTMNGFSCALVAGSTVKCWGQNISGQLGQGVGGQGSPTALTVTGAAGATAVDVGQTYACALLADGSIRCWGRGTEGELGNGTTTTLSAPVAVSGIDTATAISAEYGHTCALLAGGTIRCWGINTYGQLGDGTTNNSSVPVLVGGLNPSAKVSAGIHHTCALLPTGTVKCWGGNLNGQLGNGSTNGSATPVTVTGITTATAISSGDDHSCALLADGTVKCWGYNGYGELGDGVPVWVYAYSSTPITVTGITTAAAISAAGATTCAVLADGTVKCWGYGGYGGLGDGITTDSSTPVTVTGITTASAVSVGGIHACAVLTGGAVKCWGGGGQGQLGNGNTADSSTPVTVTGISSAAVIDAGSGHTCAVLNGGTVKCWGDDAYGQLGNSSNTDSSIPVAVSGVTTAIAISAGEAHSCALESDGTTWCWGRNDSGQLGNNSNTDSSIPVTVTGITTATAIVNGFHHSCAALDGGTVKCWGNNSSSQLGHGAGPNSSTPVTVVGL